MLLNILEIMREVLILTNIERQRGCVFAPFGGRVLIQSLASGCTPWYSDLYVVEPLITQSMVVSFNLGLDVLPGRCGWQYRVQPFAAFYPFPPSPFAWTTVWPVRHAFPGMGLCLGGVIARSPVRVLPLGARATSVSFLPLVESSHWVRQWPWRTWRLPSEWLSLS